MKIAVGIIALMSSLLALLQACAVTGLSGAIGEVSTQQAGSIGIIVALAIFFGGAFSFALPKVAQFIFGIAFLLSLVAKKDFPDMQIWGYLALILGGLLIFSSSSRNKEEKT